MAELSIYAVIIGVVTYLLFQLGRWAWKPARPDSIVFYTLAGLNLYALVYITTRLFGEFIVIPLQASLILMPNLAVPTWLLWRSWRRFRALVSQANGHD